MIWHLPLLPSLLLSISMTILLIWLRKRFTYWKNLGVHTPPFSFFVNHMKMAFLQRNSFVDRDHLLYKFFKRKDLKYGGVYFLHLPVFIPIDLDIIKHILQVDYQYFSSRGFYVNETGDPMSAHLFSLGGPKWKVLRKKFTPTFTSEKMKMMFGTILNCTSSLIDVMDRNMGKEMNVKDITARLTTDIIGNCAFGLECNSLENPDSEFRTRGQDIFLRDFKENIKQVILYIFPNLMKFFNVKMIHTEVSKFFMGIVKETIAFRELNDVQRKDFMHLLIQLRNRMKAANNKLDTEENEDPITVEEIAAQAFIFFVAGYETSSNTMAFCLYELALNESIQCKLRDEIREVLQANGGVLTYELVGRMRFLDDVMNETLRKYPPLSSLYRECTENYNIPGTNIKLQKGTKVMIPIYGIHHDPDFYPEPDKFDPTRFSENTVESKSNCSYLPFGQGPRMCIAMRFGLLQTKLGLIALLKNYEFSPSPKTPKSMKFDVRSFTLTPKDELWLDYRRVR